jgi:hypothetical protein
MLWFEYGYIPPKLRLRLHPQYNGMEKWQGTVMIDYDRSTVIDGLMFFFWEYISFVRIQLPFSLSCSCLFPF